MLKKVLQVAATFGLLLAGYAGYVRGLVILVERARPILPPSPGGPEKLGETPSSAEARRLARRAFGEGHWTGDPKQSKLQVYNTDRGYWMFAGDYRRSKDGKQVAFTPFAVIWLSKDRQALKTMTGREAILDFDEPTGITSPGGKSGHVVHAQINDEVLIRDDKGTPDDRDDLVIGPLTYAEYDERALQIRSKAPVLLRDRDLRLTAVGVQLDLRPAEGPARSGGFGFNGVQTAWLMKDIRIHVDDVGKSGILPGTAQGGTARSRTPLDLDCVGPVRIDLPKPAAPTPPGVPPAPPAPTLARFEHDVRVRRGVDRPDQLNCDTFLLTLVPAPKPAPTPASGPAPPTAGPPAPAGEGGPLSELALRRAEANGHAVWLQSQAQGARVLCKELIYHKFGPGRPDETYLRGDPGTKLHLEKIDLIAAGPDKGKVQSFTTLESIDATIFQDGATQGASRIVARGPGWLESRPDRGQPVERQATWQESLTMETRTQDVEVHRLIILDGAPTLQSPTQGNLQARDRVVLCLVPEAKTAASPTVAPGVGIGASPTSGGHRIKWMQALGDVRMVVTTATAAPAVADGAAVPASKRTMTAKEWLFVRFEAPAPEPAGAAAKAAAPAVAPTAAVAAANPEPEATAEPKPAEPDMDVRANQVWARVAQRRGETKSEVREVRLRGAVELHQGPAPGKARGTDVLGEKVDLITEGPGRAVLLAYGPDGGEAEVATDEFTIRGPSLGLDQQADKAWVDGPGRLTQMADRSLMAAAPAAENAPAEPRGAAEARPAKRPVVITWRDRMDFYGHNLDEDTGRPGPARARFFGDVVATTDDARLDCRREMRAILDREVSFARARRDPKAGKSEEAEPRPQLVVLHCFEGVHAVSRKVDPKTGAFQQLQKVLGEDVAYDRPSGRFTVEGAGLIRIYDPADRPAAPPGAPQPLSAVGASARIIRVAAKPAGAKPADRRPPGPARPGPKPAKPKAPPPDPLMLTQVSFQSRMDGKLAGSPSAAQAGRRQATFFGGVEVLRARVPDEDAVLDSDRPPLDLMSLSARADDPARFSLYLESMPPPPKSRARARTQLRADGDATITQQGTTVQGDYITYDSLTELAVASGTNGHPVSITRQDAPGQGHSDGSGTYVIYNLKTGQGEVVGPSQIQILEANTGLRFGAVGIPEPPKPVKPKRLKPTLPGRSTLDRRGFTGH